VPEDADASLTIPPDDIEKIEVSLGKERVRGGVGRDDTMLCFPRRTCGSSPHALFGSDKRTVR
jgi:hypothetical protein